MLPPVLPPDGPRCPGLAVLSSGCVLMDHPRGPLLTTQVGRLGDMYGRVRMYEAGFAVFVLGSLLCALSWNEAAIIGFRVLQAVGGAFVVANSGAVIADLYPPGERGRAYGFNALGWTIGAVLGIVLGGVIVTYVSWRWIFWINVPIAISPPALALP